MQANLRKLLAIVWIFGLIVCLLIFIYYPAVPTSILGWATLIFVGIPFWLFLEWLGGAVFEMRFFSRLSSAARIGLAIPVMIILMIASVFLIRAVQSLIDHT
jgi:hypothetical protein